MEWIASWFDGISDTWFRIFTLVGLVLGALALGLAVYQTVNGRRAVRLLDRANEELPEIRQLLLNAWQFLSNTFGKRTEIGGLKNFGAMEGAAQVGVKKRQLCATRHCPFGFGGI